MFIIVNKCYKIYLFVGASSGNMKSLYKPLWSYLNCIFLL
uniref:Uncharacterized protein n=1 Tax=Anguilla anguilla TaxID=7936 RepID=A0A0E9RQI6_ANGAN